MNPTLNDYIANKVQYLAKINRKKHSDLSSALNVSESFIHKVHSNEKHYNASHLYVLSRFLECGVSEFYPTDYNTFKRLYPLTSMQEHDFKNWLQEIENQIKYGKKEEYYE